MRKFVLVSSLSLFLLATYIGGSELVYPQEPGAPPASASLGVRLRPQLTNMWCWAASGEMVMEFLGKNVAQCVQANNRFRLMNCCNSPTPGPCAQGGWPEFNKYGFNFTKTTNVPLTWDQLRDQIGTKRKPFAFSWHWTGGGGHMMAAIGYKSVAGINYVEVNNPWPPNVGDHYTRTYANYVSGSDHTHWDDYYNVTKLREAGEPKERQ